MGWPVRFGRFIAYHTGHLSDISAGGHDCDEQSRYHYDYGCGNSYRSGSCEIWAVWRIWIYWPDCLRCRINM
jgi:hypothetical protein